MVRRSQTSAHSNLGLQTHTKNEVGRLAHLQMSWTLLEIQSISRIGICHICPLHEYGFVWPLSLYFQLLTSSEPPFEVRNRCGCTCVRGTSFGLYLTPKSARNLFQSVNPRYLFQDLHPQNASFKNRFS